MIRRCIKLPWCHSSHLNLLCIEQDEHCFGSSEIETWRQKNAATWLAPSTLCWQEKLDTAVQRVDLGAGCWEVPWSLIRNVATFWQSFQYGNFPLVRWRERTLRAHIFAFEGLGSSFGTMGQFGTENNFSSEPCVYWQCNLLYTQPGPKWCLNISRPAMYVPGQPRARFLRFPMGLRMIWPMVIVTWGGRMGDRDAWAWKTNSRDSFGKPWMPTKI